MPTLIQGPRKPEPYTWIARRISRDPSISLDTLGLIIFLASKSASFQIMPDFLKRRFRVGKTTWQKMAREMVGAGLLADKREGYQGPYYTRSAFVDKDGKEDADMMPNRIAQGHLSLNAIGMMGFIGSLDPEDLITVADVQARFGIAKQKRQRVGRELIESGLIVLDRGGKKGGARLILTPLSEVQFVGKNGAPERVLDARLNPVNRQADLQAGCDRLKNGQVEGGDGLKNGQVEGGDGLKNGQVIPIVDEIYYNPYLLSIANLDKGDGGGWRDDIVFLDQRDQWVKGQILDLLPTLPKDAPNELSFVANSMCQIAGHSWTPSSGTLKSWVTDHGVTRTLSAMIVARERMNQADGEARKFTPAGFMSYTNRVLLSFLTPEQVQVTQRAAIRGPVHQPSEPEESTLSYEPGALYTDFDLSAVRIKLGVNDDDFEAVRGPGGLRYKIKDSVWDNLTTTV